MTNQNKCESGETSYVSSWLKSKLLKTDGSNTPSKRTDQDKYTHALFECGEAML